MNNIFRTPLYVGLGLVCAGLMGCIPDHAAERPPGEPPPCPAPETLGAPLRLFSVPIDYSLSWLKYIPIDRTLSDVADLVISLPLFAARVEIRWITADSYADSANLALSMLVRGVEPEPAPPKNIFNLREKREYQRQLAYHQHSLACARADRQRIAEAIRGLGQATPKKPARLTDIHGALAKTVERAHAFGALPTLIVLYSDGLDDAGQPLPRDPLPPGSAVLVRSDWPGMGSTEVREVKAALQTLAVEHLHVRPEALRFEPLFVHSRAMDLDMFSDRSTDSTTPDKRR